MPLTPVDVTLFVPNIIGYFRIVAAIASFYVAFDYPAWCLGLYTASFIFDAVDGWAARKLNQCSSFGAILDMFSDRAATAALIVIVSHVLGPLTALEAFAASMLVFLDVASHFARMYMSMFLGKGSHKDTDDSIFSLLGLYYSSKPFMGVLCVGQEFCYILLYANKFYGAEHTWIYGALLATVVPCLLKQIVNVQQLVDAMWHIAENDAMEINKKTKQ